MCSGGLVRSVITAGGAETGTGQLQERDSQDNIYITNNSVCSPGRCLPTTGTYFPISLRIGHARWPFRRHPRLIGAAITSAWSALLPRQKRRARPGETNNKPFGHDAACLLASRGGEGLKYGHLRPRGKQWDIIVRPNQSSFPARRRPSLVAPSGVSACLLSRVLGAASRGSG